MNKIIFPLDLGMKGPEVGDLQDALQLLLDKAIILRGDDTARQELSAALQQERTEKTYGRVTSKLVSVFQEERWPEASGEVDEATANAINEVVNSLEPVEPDKVPTFFVRGHVREEDGTPFTGGRVLAYDRGLRKNKILLGEAIRGNRDGFYEISYKTQNLRKDSANLLVEVVNEKNEPITLPHDVIYNAGPEETVELVIDRNKYRGRSEYTRLKDTVLPALDGMSLIDLTSPDDIKVIAANTSFNARHIEYLAEAARFAERTQLPHEVGYLIARQNLPTIPRLLMRQDRQSIRQAIENGISENLIPEVCIDDVISDLHARAVDEELEIVQDADGDITLGTLFDLSPVLSGDMAHQRAFIDVYFEHVRNIDTLWEKLCERPEFDDERIVGEFQFMMELSTLTRSLSLADAIQSELRQRAETQRTETLQHYDLARLDLPSLRRLAENAGVPADQVEARAVEIFRPIEARYPTRVFFHQLERENEELPGAVDVHAFLSKKLAEEPDFDLGRQHVLNYLKDIDKAEKEQLLSWQRVYRIAPVQDRYDAIRSLKRMPDLNSAIAVANMGQGAFVRRFTAAMDYDDRAQEIASRVWTKARHVHNMALSLMSDFSPAFNRVVPFGIPHLAISGEIGNPIPLNDLFGSLDYCECKHCESVYSPAAYLVDLLHFLQSATPNKDNVSPYATLLSRRSDLSRLELSCENTDTLIPYIDLVNEILEDVVARTPLALTVKCPDKKPEPSVHPAQPAIAGYGTPLHEVSSNLTVDMLNSEKIAELIQPVIPQPDLPVPLGTVGTKEWIFPDQKYMVITDLTGLDPKLLVYPLKANQTEFDSATLSILPQKLSLGAYARLAKEVYPWNLPFDLWFEEARIYLQHLQFKRYLWLERLGCREIDVACSNLDITPLERDLITGMFYEEEKDLWGLPEGYQLDDLHEVKFFMRQAGFDIRTSQAFKETRRLLIGTYYINRDGSLNIPVLDDTCDLSCLQIIHSAGLEWDKTLKRIRRFVRLQRKLGWTSTELDKAITAFSTDLNDEFLQHLSCIKRLHTDLHVPLVEMFSWWDLLDTAEDRVEKVESKKEKSLYEKLFLNPSVENPMEKFFALNSERTDLMRVPEFTHNLPIGTVVNKAFFSEYFLNKYVEEHAAFQPDVQVIDVPNDGGWIINIVNTGQEYLVWRGGRHLLQFSMLHRITANAPKVTAALEISAADLDRLLITAKNPNGEVPDILNLTNLSHLYRITSLSRALNLKIKEFLSAKALIKIDPFKNPKSSLEFTEKIRKIKTSRFSIIELDYLFRHKFEVLDNVSFSEKEIRRILNDLRNGLLRITSETVPVPDPQGELTRQKLSMLLTPTQVDEIMTVISGEEKEEQKKNTLIEKLLGPYTECG